MNRSLKSLLAVFLAIFTATIVIACQVEEEAIGLMGNPLMSFTLTVALSLILVL